MNPRNFGALEGGFGPHIDDIFRALRKKFPGEFRQGNPIHAPSAFPEFKYRPDSENRVGRGVHSVYGVSTHNVLGNFAITGPHWEAKKNRLVLGMLSCCYCWLFRIVGIKFPIIGCNFPP
jgi:hypothetical protein